MASQNPYRAKPPTIDKAGLLSHSLPRRHGQLLAEDLGVVLNIDREMGIQKEVTDSARERI